MTVTLTPLPREERPWLHAATIGYFAELAPALGTPQPEHLDIWWDEDRREAWQILSGKAPCGFALFRQPRAGGVEFSEFCILPEHRNAGIGTHAATLCLDCHPGAWRVGVAGTLPGTARFWDRLLRTLPGITGLERGPALTPYQCHSYTFIYKGAP